MASTDIQECMQKSDELYSQQQFREAMDLLDPFSTESEDVELLWRVMRLCFRLGKTAKDKPEADALAEKAYKLSQRGLKINENVFGIQKVFKLSIPGGRSMKYWAIPIEEYFN